MHTNQSPECQGPADALAGNKTPTSGIWPGLDGVYDKTVNHPELHGKNKIYAYLPHYSLPENL